MQLTVQPGGTFTLQLSDPQEARMIEAAGRAYAAALAAERELKATYHLGENPTKGRGYDDRLTMRTGYSRSTLIPMLKNGIGRKMQFGVLVGLFAANKWIVTEAAVRACFGHPE